MDAEIPPEVETTAFRIFQESLTNAARHAKARRIEPECSIHGGVLTLKVRDDGVGIDPQVMGNPTSLGLVGMLERAADAGGNVNFNSSSGSGTEVVLTLPIKGTSKSAFVSST
jgi:signal transduction histidine kinase